MYDDVFERLARSAFRSRFQLGERERRYIAERGLDTIRLHAEEFIAKRVAPACIANDGKQTPMKNHPVFIAQHATATCCRGCIEKWHGFRKGVELDAGQQAYLVDLIMEWIRRQVSR